MGFYRRFGKRALDILLCGAGLAVLSPVFAALALLVRLDSPGPVFFAQKRIGKDHKTFQLYKFRSMRVDTPHDVPTHLLGDPTAYLTSIGKFLRKTSLDELPQLLNILRGEMSLVGPRPALWNQADLIALRDQNGASAVLPGLTGLAQVSGRDELPLAEKSAPGWRLRCPAQLAHGCCLLDKDGCPRAAWRGRRAGWRKRAPWRAPGRQTMLTRRRGATNG